MALTTTTEVPATVNRIHQTRLLRTAEPLLVYYVGSLPAEIAEHAGSFTAHWRQIANLTPTTSALTELTSTLTLPTRTATQLSSTDLTATIAKYGDHVFLSEEVDLINPTTHGRRYATNLGIQAGRSLNRLQRNILEDNATLIRAGGAATDGEITDAMSLTIQQNAVNTLSRNSAMKFTGLASGSTRVGSVPIPASYWGICHVDVEEDIRGLTGFIAVEQYAGHIATMPGEFGMVTRTRIRWLSTEEASVDTDSGGDPGSLRSTSGQNADLYTSVVFGQEAHGTVGLGVSHIQSTYKSGDLIPAIQMIFHGKGTAGPGDPFNEVQSLAWKSFHAGLILDATWIRGLRTGANRLT